MKFCSELFFFKMTDKSSVHRVLSVKEVSFENVVVVVVAVEVVVEAVVDFQAQKSCLQKDWCLGQFQSQNCCSCYCCCCYPKQMEPAVEVAAVVAAAAVAVVAAVVADLVAVVCAS